MLGGLTFTSIVFMNLHNFSKITTFEELKIASNLYVLAFIQQFSVKKSLSFRYKKQHII